MALHMLFIGTRRWTSAILVSGPLNNILQGTMLGRLLHFSPGQINFRYWLKVSFFFIPLWIWEG